MENRLRFPSLIVFISNTCIMVLELVAGRIVAPYIGVSLYTWTSIIGVILAGISIGNYWGGKLADRYASRRLLGVIFIAAGFLSVTTLFILDSISSRGIPVVFLQMPLILRIVFLITAIFFLPSALLGMISPLVVKLALNDLERTGETIGRIYASSSFGSIIGTFATGFFLISWLGTRAIVIGLALILAVVGIIIGNFFKTRWVNILLSILIIGIAFLPPTQSLIANGPCLVETNYFCIKIYDQVWEDGRTYKAMALDRLVHSLVDVENPDRLEYGYERIYPEILEYLVDIKGTELKVLVIGGGGYSLPRYIETVYPQMSVDVVEIDPGVTQAAHDFLGLPPETKIRTFNEDGRQYLVGLSPAVKYDLILLDAVNDLSVPYHLTTLEFDQLLASHLSEDGLLVTNLIDGYRRLFASAYLRTIQQVFPHTALLANTADWQTSIRTTYQVIASHQPIDWEKLKTYDGGNGRYDIQTGYISEKDMQQILVEDNPGMILTDDYVPVDNLLAPVFADTEQISMTQE